MPTLVGMNMSFLTFCALFQLPDWMEVLGLPVPERMAALRDTDTRIRLENRANAPEAGVFARLTGWGRYRIGDTYSAANEGLKGRLVADIARERGVRDFFALLDIVLADDLRTVLWPGPTDDDAESWRLRVDAWRSPYAMLGGSDAGAHLDRMCGAPYTTEFLGDCLRGKQLIGLEEAIHDLTDAPARLFGLRDRGRLAEGWIADVVVLDPATSMPGRWRWSTTCPVGPAASTRPPSGIEQVFVNGQLAVDAWSGHRRAGRAHPAIGSRHRDGRGGRPSLTPAGTRSGRQGGAGHRGQPGDRRGHRGGAGRGRGRRWPWPPARPPSQPQRTPGTLDETVARIADAGGQALAVPTNLAVTSRGGGHGGSHRGALRPPRLLVNNAAVTFVGDLDIPLHRYELVMAVNATAPLVAMQRGRPAPARPQAAAPSSTCRRWRLCTPIPG